MMCNGGVVVEVVACGHAGGAPPRQGAGAGRGKCPTVLGPKVEDADGNLPEVGASRINEGAASPPADAGREGAGVRGDGVNEALVARGHHGAVIW